MSSDSKCRHCGECCRYFIPVLPEELQKISDYLGVTDSQSLTDPDFQDPALSFLAKDADDHCQLQTADGLCSVHAVKPQICRNWVCEIPKVHSRCA